MARNAHLVKPRRTRGCMTMNVGIEDFTQLDAYHGLLPALARGLDVHDIFQQRSAAAERIVPHDVANLFLRVDDADNFRLCSGEKGWCYEA